MIHEHWFDRFHKETYRANSRRQFAYVLAALLPGLAVGELKAKGNGRSGKRHSSKGKGKSGRGNRKGKGHKPAKPKPQDPLETCDDRCGRGLTCCAGLCVNTETDRDFCGDCNRHCQGDEICLAGSCYCDDGFPGGIRRLCPPDGCVNTHTSQSHCGECNHACEAYELCYFGDCKCPGGLDKCGTECVNTDDDNHHCGTCNNACREGLICVNGQCLPGCLGGAQEGAFRAAAGDSCLPECPSGTTRCGGSCFNLTNDHLHCGSCENRCRRPGWPQNEICVNGGCVCEIAGSVWDDACGGCANTRDYICCGNGYSCPNTHDCVAATRDPNGGPGYICVGQEP